jgi:hypothetical protein
MTVMARTDPPSATQPDEPTELPWAWDYAMTRRALGGIAQSTLEQLVARGPDDGGIASFVVGVAGSRKPRRMFRPADVREFIDRRVAEERETRATAAKRVTDDVEQQGRAS